jgi:macrolide-specific efflux system membrane fusion protein
MTSTKKKSWWAGWRLIALLVVLALVGWAGYARFIQKPPAPEVITAEVERTDLEDTVLASGVIKSERDVNVGAQVSGQIRKLHVELGDQVKQGQLLAEIDSTTQANTLRNAEAQVALLQAQLQARQALHRQAELAFQRQQGLFRQDAGSKAELDAAEATLATTQADIKALQAQIRQATISVDTARVNLGYTRIVAPIDGVVTAVIAEEGRTVNAVQSAPTIIKLSRLDRVLIKAQISEADVVRVKPGLPVYFTILGEPRQRYEASLRAIEPSPESEQVDSSTKSTTSTSSSTTAAVYYNGLFEVPNPEGKLRVAMTAQVFIVLDKVEGALAIPASALGQRDRKAGTYAVRVLEEQAGEARVVDRQVKIGLNNRVQAQVLSGLKEGDRVVVGEAAGSGASGGSRRPPGMF